MLENLTALARARRPEQRARFIGREGREDWVWVQVEVRGTRQSEFAERMFVCGLSTLKPDGI
jgi:hypothetical protein